MHGAVLEAIRGRDSERARIAMNDLLDDVSAAPQARPSHRTRAAVRALGAMRVGKSDR
jgi:hypothetical protein